MLNRPPGIRFVPFVRKPATKTGRSRSQKTLPGSSPARMGYPPSAGCWSPWRIVPGGLPHEIPKAKCQLIDAFRDPLLSPIFACGPTSYSVLTNHLPGREWALPVFAGASLTGTGWYAPGPPPLLASVLVRGQHEMSGGSDFRRTGRFQRAAGGLTTVTGSRSGAAGQPEADVGRHPVPGRADVGLEMA